MVGRVEVIVGPMFSGKTEELLRRVRRLKYSKQKYMLFKHSLDKRYSSDSITSHCKDSEKCIPVCDSSELLECVEKNMSSVDVIAIDETQFFDNKIVDVAWKLANAGKRVIVAGLDMDYLGKTFGSMGDLLAIADSVMKVKAVCYVCGEDATFSKRIVQNNNTVVVGGAEMYTAVCRKHFLHCDKNINE
ncbi:MAG: thymidine kinase [Cytophagales bacterium]|nr:thymidine kinase [Cytophagales bacterium]